MRLQNKVAILTGCGSGIGEAVSHRFAMEGAKCILADINGEHAKKVALEINNKGILSKKEIYDITNMNKHKFSQKKTEKKYQKDSYICS